MKFRFVTIELVRQRKRVRRAVRVLQRDKAQTALALDHFLKDVVASPSGLATFATLGFCFDRARGRSSDPDSESDSRRRNALVRRTGSLVTLVFWGRRMFAAMRRTAHSR